MTFVSGGSSGAPGSGHLIILNTVLTLLLQALIRTRIGYCCKRRCTRTYCRYWCSTHSVAIGSHGHTITVNAAGKRKTPSKTSHLTILWGLHNGIRMSEQPRTIKIYNLLAGTNNLLVKVMHIFRLIQVCQQTVRYCTARYSGWLRGCFQQWWASWHLVEDHRGKTVYDVASGTRYLFLNSVRYRKMLPGYRRRGVSEVERHSLGEGYGSRKMFRIREAEETKNNLMQVASEILRRFRMLQIWKSQRRKKSRAGSMEKVSGIAEPCWYVNCKDIEWPALP